MDFRDENSRLKASAPDASHRAQLTGRGEKTLEVINRHGRNDGKQRSGYNCSGLYGRYNGTFYQIGETGRVGREALKRSGLHMHWYQNQSANPEILMRLYSSVLTVIMDCMYLRMMRFKVLGVETYFVKDDKIALESC